MKKHPVDDLFKRKLSSLEKAPSENAWLRIQAESKTKHERTGWIWYAAASVMVGLFGGYLVWQNNQANLSVPVEKRVSVIKEPGNNTIEAREALKPIDALPGATYSEPIQANSVARQSVQVEKKDRKESEGLAQQERIAVQLIEKPGTLVSQNSVAEVTRLPEVIEQKLDYSQQPAGEILKPDSEPARTIVVAVESDLNETEKPRASKFSRVFRQLKNARAGERVDWEEVGFNPKTLVARVDDRLRGKDEKESEHENPKNRTKL